jgi:hypothetical protein
MKTQDIEQLKGEVESHKNTIQSLSERIDYRKQVLAGLNDIGRPSEFKLVYHNRIVTVLVEDPNKWATVINDIKAIQQAEVDEYTAHIDKDVVALEEKRKALKEGYSILDRLTGSDKEELNAWVEEEVKKRLAKPKK